jgi:hypothetical protein
VSRRRCASRPSRSGRRATRSITSYCNCSTRPVTGLTGLATGPRHCCNCARRSGSSHGRSCSTSSRDTRSDGYQLGSTVHDTQAIPTSDGFWRIWTQLPASCTFSARDPAAIFTTGGISSIALLTPASSSKRLSSSTTSSSTESFAQSRDAGREDGRAVRPLAEDAFMRAWLAVGVHRLAPHGGIHALA